MGDHATKLALDLRDDVNSFFLRESIVKCAIVFFSSSLMLAMIVHFMPCQDLKTSDPKIPEKKAGTNRIYIFMLGAIKI